MQSGSQPTNPPEQPAYPFANFIGTAIALLTLIIPLLIIAHYSPSSLPPAEAIPLTESAG